MAVRRRVLEFERGGGEWTVNGRTWQDVVDSGFREVVADPGLDDIEVWSLQNGGGGWFHPIHLHLVDQKILSRNGRPPFDYELGPKDTVYVGENETVEVIIKFGPHRGRYMIHCHNTSHEDHDMMVQFSVGLGADEVDPHDPIATDPPRRDDDGDDGRAPDPRPPGAPPRDDDDSDDDDSDDEDGGAGGSGSGAPAAPAVVPPTKSKKRPKRPKGKKKGKGKKGKKGKGKPRPPRRRGARP
jgi:hypothetical protein